MPYTPPAWNACDIDLVVPYTPPAWNAADIEFIETAFQNVLPSSLASTVAFGTTAVDNAPYILPSGLPSSSAFGTATIYNNARLIYVPEMVYTAYGTADVRDPVLRAFPPSITPTTALGTPQVENAIRFMFPDSVVPSFAFGTTDVALQNREIFPTGLASEAYGFPSIFDPAQEIVQHGFDWLAWGTASLDLKNKYVSVTGTKYDEFGTVFIENKNREIFPQRIDPGPFGTATVYNLTQYRAMQGFRTDSFGLPYIIGPRYIVAGNQVFIGFGATTEVSNFIRTIYPAPAQIQAAEVSRFGANIIRNKSLFLYPDGIAPEDDIGACIVAAPPFDIVDVLDNGFDESVIGDHSIYYTGRNRLFPNGINPTAFGRPTIFPATLYPTSVVSGTYGRPTVSNYIRYLDVRTVGDASRYGTQWVSNYIRYVYPFGWLDEIVWDEYGPINPDGTIPGVKGGATYVYPDGFDASGTTYDPCGFPRTPPIPRPSVHP